MVSPGPGKPVSLPVNVLVPKSKNCLFDPKVKGLPTDPVFASFSGTIGLKSITSLSSCPS